jgi:tripartite-type tricarboxylate transporter receptor subunit TctC
MNLISLLASTLLALSLSSGAALAADWPTRAVHIIVPYPAGGGADTVARDMGDFLAKKWKQPVVIENKAGASGSIGATMVAKAAPDGYTLLINQAGPTTAFLTRKNLPYNPNRDFTNIILLGRGPTVLSVPASSPYKTLAELIAAAKANPGMLNYGSPGLATPGDLAAEMFQSATGTKLQRIPFSGSAGVMTNLLGGQIQMSFDTVSANAELIRSGQTRAFIVSSNTRSTIIPDVPTGAEAGLNGWESYAWYGVAAPAKLPAEIVAKINADLTEYLSSPSGQRRLDELGLLAKRGGTPEEFSAFIQSELTRLAPVVTAAGLVE